jgi:hypothetical protein
VSVAPDGRVYEVFVVGVGELRRIVKVFVREAHNTPIGVNCMPEEPFQYPPGTKWVEHMTWKHPDTKALNGACDICQASSWDGIPEGWLEEEDKDA